jgi:hypothetical protein
MHLHNIATYYVHCTACRNVWAYGILEFVDRRNLETSVLLNVATSHELILADGTKCS